MLSKKSKILFIVNPVSGRKKKENLHKIIKEELSSDTEFKIVEWESPMQNICDLIKNNIDADTNIIVAVGGDGTINKVANYVYKTDKTLAIIPLGSGNGFARFLNIPINLRKSIRLLENGISIKIDTVTINNKLFISTAGIGFDAFISKKFEECSKRGLFTYIKETVIHLLAYKENTYNLTIDNKELTTKAFLITFANAGQYGGNAEIAPKAKINDGELDIVIMKKPPLLNIIPTAIRLYLKNIHKSPFVKVIKGKNISLTTDKKLDIHFDGENMGEFDKLKIEINRATLNVLVSKKYNK
ncbi:MAG: diacylglycerol kinase family protein [Bacteroidota bacterium]|nr:diacylglycerol kinase family protein [Bacteroidota bacterium]